MNYESRSLGFKLCKVARYCRLYGPRRTLVKVQGFRHQKRTYTQLPRMGTIGDKQTVGLIGCGNYAFSNIAYFLNRDCGRVIGACMDVDIHRAASLSQSYRVPLYTTDATDILDNPAIRLVYIASNHHSHAEYAIQGLLRGKDVYVEKPHVVTEDQLHGLVDVMSASAGRVYLGFNRPQSRLARILQRYLQEQAGPALLNWFVAGHEIEPDHWYFHTDEGGRVLGNLCHWTDFLLSFAGPDPFPIRIVPVRSVSRDVDVVVSYVFRDHTIGTISFSAKGHAFEGVREKLNVHKGNCLAVLDDFQRLRIDVVERRHTFRRWFRDHGHRDNIVGAFRSSTLREPYDRTGRQWHIANTAHLFLKTKQALEENRELTVYAYPSALRQAA